MKVSQLDCHPNCCSTDANSSSSLWDASLALRHPGRASDGCMQVHVEITQRRRKKLEESEKHGASLCFQRGRVKTTCQLNNSIPLRHPSHLIPQHKTLTFSSWRFQQRSHELLSMYKVMPWKPRCSGHLGSWHPWHHLDLGTSAG